MYEEVKGGSGTPRFGKTKADRARKTLGLKGSRREVLAVLHDMSRRKTQS